MEVFSFEQEVQVSACEKENDATEWMQGAAGPARRAGPLCSTRGVGVCMQERFARRQPFFSGVDRTGSAALTGAPRRVAADSARMFAQISQVVHSVTPENYDILASAGSNNALLGYKHLHDLVYNPPCAESAVKTRLTTE